jgi:hypothetical protein
MRIILWFAPVLIAGLTLYYFVRVDGRPVLAAVGLAGFSVANITLNAWFIVVLGWGIEGAAWASALADLLMFAILITHLFHRRCTLRLVRVDRRWGVVLRAAWNGFSEFTNELSIGLVVLLFNWVMITRLGVAGVAAYTIIGYLVMLGLEVCYGISESLQPTVSKNLGARQPARIRQYLLLGLATALVVGLTASALFVFVPEAMVGLFLGEADDETLGIALEFIAWFWPAFLFNGMNLTLASYFTALHRPVPSAAIALARSLLLPAAGLLLLPTWLGDRGIFVAIPLAEAITFGFALALVFILPPRFDQPPGEPGRRISSPGSGSGRVVDLVETEGMFVLGTVDEAHVPALADRAVGVLGEQDFSAPRHVFPEFAGPVHFRALGQVRADLQHLAIADTDTTLGRKGGGQVADIEGHDSALNLDRGLKGDGRILEQGEDVIGEAV